MVVVFSLPDAEGDPRDFFSPFTFCCRGGLFLEGTTGTNPSRRLRPKFVPLSFGINPICSCLCVCERKKVFHRLMAGRHEILVLVSIGSDKFFSFATTKATSATSFGEEAPARTLLGSAERKAVPAAAQIQFSGSVIWHVEEGER